MQAYKLKGIIDNSGHLTLASPLNIPPGEVEVILLQSVATTSESNGSTTEPSTEPPKLKRATKIKAFAAGSSLAKDNKSSTHFCNKKMVGTLMNNSYQNLN